MLGKNGSRDAFDRQIFDILCFEQMLALDGALILKFWFHAPKKKQRARLKALASDRKPPGASPITTKKHSTNTTPFTAVAAT